MTTDLIPFHRPFMSGNEARYLQHALDAATLCAGGAFTARCEALLVAHTGAQRALLTHSCTNALELAAVLSGVGPGDEVILPSFTFTSTATAFALRGATPVFVDVEPATLNIDPAAAAAAITPRTRALVPVHYAGTSCDMTALQQLADQHRLWLIEDAAQAIGASYKGQPLGSMGRLGTLSFHATKNLGCGEGGALLINDPDLVERAEILHDKGTTRAQFRAGRIRQYDWVDLGLSAPPSELQAAHLLAQLEQLATVTQQRRLLWQAYQQALAPLVQAGLLQTLHVPVDCTHNGHIFGLLFADGGQRDRAQAALAAAGLQTALHYQPLHLSPAGQQLGRAHGALPHASTLPGRLLRLPMWHGVPAAVPETVARVLGDLFGGARP
ncbi:dTDP-4-amino-4,6-dideoxygalactose transaminase [Isoalcanivorax beigongshangi]|uniref:dTDP-4-amino-4,6-dideoxygalactose transaminase n=1 Tax=Isoalcanivorax beigongshangi TaxID=3238810 RepID=A0ABV4AGM3_9GAMM